MLANLMPINPYGSEDPTRRRARDAYYGGLLGDGQQSGAISAAEAAATPSITQRQRMSAAMADEARQRGLLQDALDPRGRNQMRPMAPVGSGRGTMGMPMQGSGRGTMGMPAVRQNMMESGTRPIRPMPETLPANLAMPISSSNLFPLASQEIGPNIQQPEGMMMSKQQFVNFILPKYREEYGRNPTQQQMDMAYNTYMSNMGIANNSTNDTSSRELELSSSIAPKADEVFNVLDFANKIAQPSFGNAGRGFDYRVTPYNKNDPYAARQNYLGLLQ